MRATIKRRTSTGVAVAALVVGMAGVGCAQEAENADVVTGIPEGYAASPDFLAKTIDDSSSESFRYDMTLHMALQVGRDDLDLDVPFASGIRDGDQSQLHMDLGAMFQEMIDEVGHGQDLPAGFDGDMTMDVLVDAENVYIRAPFFATLADQLPVGLDVPAGAMMDAFADLGDGWGRVDLAALGDAAPDDIESQLSSGQGFDPMALFNLVAGASEVEDLGQDQIDGVPVTGMAATVTMADLMEAQGSDSSVQLGEASGPLGDVVDAMRDADVPIEVWIDGQGLVRRIDFSLADVLTDAMAQLGDVAGGDPPSNLGGLDGFKVGYTLDFSDYGQVPPIDFPAESDTVDLTSTFAEVLGG
jgi:hypothetical protein